MAACVFLIPNPEVCCLMKRSSFDFSLPVFFVVAFGFAWLCWIPVALESANRVTLPVPRELLILLGTFGPLFSAFGLALWSEGLAGIKDLLRRVYQPAISLKLILLVLGVPIGVAYGAFLLTSQEKPNFNPVTLLVTFVVFFFLGGSVAEEFGWRGFALPRLLTAFGEGPAGIGLGIIWACWHLPLFWVAGTSQSVTPFWVFAVFTVALSVLYTWVHVRSGGNLLAALLLHTATNVTVVMFPPPTQGIDRSMYVSAAAMASIACGVSALRFFRR